MELQRKYGLSHAAHLFVRIRYTMQNIFSNFLCFASLFAHLSSISNNFNCNEESWILGKLNHEFTDAIL